MILCRLSRNVPVVDFSSMFLIRVTQTGEQELATMQTGTSSADGYKQPFLSTSGEGVEITGHYSETDPVLGISLPVSTLSCNDPHEYKCKLAYRYTSGQTNLTKEAYYRNLTIFGMSSLLRKLSC
jgi:hypothetical protein